MTQEPSAKLQSEKTAAEIVVDIKSIEGRERAIVGARKLPSNTFTLTFKSAEIKDQWKNQGKIINIFGPGALIKESTLDVIVFGFPLKAINTLQIKQRIKIIMS